MDAGFWSGRKVFLTGHTGFKGSWLSQWLIEVGAVVHGYALAPETTPALFDQLGLANRVEHEIADIRDAGLVRQSVNAFRPDFLIHMAAQPLVRRSYAKPLETYDTNVMGTIHVLEALRGLSTPCAAIIVTTDKCYENHESGRAYEESDPMGGRDPYSSSKAMVEIATEAYRKSFFHNHPVKIASARAGNVIGGGDWAEDRIVPDAMCALDQGKQISVRNPHAVRPWQHVLEPLSGYLLLAIRLSVDPTVAGAFNFGPAPESNRTVADLVMEILKHRPGNWVDSSDPKDLHEAALLNLSISKARNVLGWRPLWDFGDAVEKTTRWYSEVHALKVSPFEVTSRQIAEYSNALAEIDM